MRRGIKLDLPRAFVTSSRAAFALRVEETFDGGGCLSGAASTRGFFAVGPACSEAMPRLAVE
jgi:hypothetical protein